jgi:hypothetical protein
VPYFYRLLTLAFISICCSVQAQNYTISGAITDATNGEELIGASIVVKEKTGVGAVTNAYGFYSLTLPKGSYNFLIRYVGFQDSMCTIALDSNVRLNFRLSPASTELKQIEVVAGKNENLTKAEMGVVKLSVKEMEKIPVLFGERDIMKTLQLLPGVKSAGEGNSGFFVRGGAADQNLILLDEAPVYNASHLLGFFSTFNSDVIKDVTLYKGNSPAEYGGRLSSTVDIKMKDGNDKNYVIGGGIGLISSRLNVEGPIVKDKGSFIISARRTYADLFLKAAPDPNVRKSVLYFYDINAKANYRIGKKDRIYLSGYFGRDKFGINNTSRFSINYGNITGTLRWNHIFSDKVFSNTSVIVNNFDYGIDISTSVISIDIRSQVLDYNLKQDFQYYINAKHAIKFGFMTTMHTIKPGSVSSRDTSKVNAISLTRKYGWENGIYIQHEWKPVRQVEINYGIRLSTYSSTGPGTYYSYNADGTATDSARLALGRFGKTYVNPEPRLAISYNFVPQHSFKASYSRNTQNVHQLSNATIGSPTDLWVLSSNNIKTEIADQVALGYYLNFWKDRFELSIEGYYKYLHNQIDYKNNAQLRAICKGVVKVLHAACTTRCNNRYIHCLRHPGQRLIGKALFSAIVVHAGKQYFARTSIGRLFHPAEKLQLSSHPATVQVYLPACAFIHPGIYCQHQALAPEAISYICYQPGIFYGSRVQAYLIGTCPQQGIHIFHTADAATYGERYINSGCYPAHQLYQRLALFIGSGNVQKNQFICSFCAIPQCQLHRVACIAQSFKVDAFYRASILDIKAGYDSLCQQGCLFFENKKRRSL